MFKRLLTWLNRPTLKRSVDSYYPEIDLLGYDGLVTKACVQKDVYNAFIRHYHTMLKMSPDCALAIQELYNVSILYYPTVHYVANITALQPKVLLHALVRNDLIAFQHLEKTLDPMVALANIKTRSMQYVCGTPEWEEWEMVVTAFRQLIVHHNQNVRWCKWLACMVQPAAAFTRTISLPLTE
jgi:hypothetical protein